MKLALVIFAVGTLASVTLHAQDIAGTWQGTLQGALAPSEPGGAVHPFEAIEEQLGLELKSAKAPVDCLVVEHVEKPSQN